jgi:hypothetical protein
MLKKAVIVYLLVLAYTCVLVHNLIPHHHHTYTSDKQHHHQDEHHEEAHHHGDHNKEAPHDQDEDNHENATDHVFAYHQHTTTDSQIKHIVSLSENSLFKSKIHTLPLSFFYFHFKPPKIPDEPLRLNYISCTILSCYPSSCSLRAPPSILS